MLKKNNILPSILAFISTVITIVIGFVWFNKIDTQNFDSSTNKPKNENTVATNGEKLSVTNINPRNKRSNSAVFAAPNIVPQGTSVRINGSTRMIGLNQALKKSFQRQFPGTAIITNADGSEVGIDLLRTGKIDLAAILRPLSNEEKAQGLATVTVDESILNTEDTPTSEVLYYAYRQPATIEVEAFLGFALSPQGQEAIANRK